MQFKLSTIIITAALFLPSAISALSDSQGIGSTPGAKARARWNLARSFESTKENEKRADGSPGTWYNILMGEVACGGYYQPDDYVSILPCRCPFVVVYEETMTQIVAMNSPDFNNGAACGKTITISYNGVTAQATVRDEVSVDLQSCDYLH